MSERIVVIGAGHAGGAAAIALRELGFSGSLTLIGDEAHAPYERPSLSKGFLSGAEPEPVWLAPAARWDVLKVTLKTGQAAVEIDREKGEVVLADGSREPFDSLILATGGKVRPLPLPSCEGVHYVRTIDDARDLAARIRSGDSALIVGGGVIGLEAASTLQAMGVSTVVIEAGDRLLGRNIPAEAAQWLADAHHRIGVDVRLGRSLAALEASDNAPLKATLDDGTALDIDLVVAGIGIIPCTEIAKAAGLSVDGGVLVDDDYRSPDDQRVFAIGDLAARLTDGAARRMETWAHAQTSARKAALAILGLPAEVEPTPWFWTDQCGHNLQILGDPSAGDATVARGDHIRLYLREGALVGAVCLDRPRDFAAARRLIGKTLNPELAADPAVDLRKAA